MQSSVLAKAGGDGVDGAHLAVLVQEAVALIALRNAGAGLSLSPQVADFWISGTPERTLEHQIVHCISRLSKEPCSIVTLVFVGTISYQTKLSGMFKVFLDICFIDINKDVTR